MQQIILASVDAEIDHTLWMLLHQRPGVHAEAVENAHQRFEVKHGGRQ